MAAEGRGSRARLRGGACGGRGRRRGPSGFPSCGVAMDDIRLGQRRGALASPTGTFGAVGVRGCAACPGNGGGSSAVECCWHAVIATSLDDARGLSDVRVAAAWWRALVPHCERRGPRRLRSNVIRDAPVARGCDWWSHRRSPFRAHADGRCAGHRDRAHRPSRCRVQPASGPCKATSAPRGVSQTVKRGGSAGERASPGHAAREQRAPRHAPQGLVDRGRRAKPSGVLTASDEWSIRMMRWAG